jgi:hypothetical protein
VKRDDFSAMLVRLDLPRSIVSFDGPGVGECYAIEHGISGWTVYWSERGERRGARTFESDSDGLRYLLGWIIDHNVA